ncbi:unnamed protein product [Jaminaea pallidilutea]
MQAQVNPNEDTEFHDALRARGIIPQKPPSRSPSPELPTANEIREAAINNATVEDIDRALEEDGIDADDDERRLLQLRRERLQALAQERKRGRFGRVYPISRPDYTREVTEASKEDPNGEADADGEEKRDDEEDDDAPAETGAGSIPSAQGSAAAQGKVKAKGTGVVCFLYKDAIEECRLLSGYLDRLAAKYPGTKFVSIIGDQCIPNYPDKNLPTLLVYRNGELHRQIIGLRPEIGLDGMKTKCEDIELLLTAIGVIDRSSVPGSSTHEDTVAEQGGARSGRDKAEAKEQEREEAEDDDEGFGGSNRKYHKPTIRSQEEEDDDLDWDL